MKKVSIITVSYNNISGLQKTIESVLDQDAVGYEYLIIDGGSTDGSVALLHKNTNKITYWISEKDGGIYNAMNKGIAKATGEYLMFLNSGDYLVNRHVLAECYDYLNNCPDADILYGAVLLDIFADGISKEVIYSYPSPLDLKFLTNSTINHQASLIKSSLFKEFGLYPENYRIASDYWLFLTSLLQGKKYHYLDYPLVKYDTNGVSASGNYENYLIEKRLIWESLVPDYAKVMFKQNEELERDNADYKHILGFKIVKAAIGFVKAGKAIKKSLNE